MYIKLPTKIVGIQEGSLPWLLDDCYHFVSYLFSNKSWELVLSPEVILKGAQSSGMNTELQALFSLYIYNFVEQIIYILLPSSNYYL